MGKGNQNYFAPLTDAEIDELIMLHDDAAGGLADRNAAGAGCWDSGIEFINTCDHMEVPNFLVKFSLKAHMKIQQLMKHYPHLEWLGYLVGKMDYENGEVIVDDIKIPDQSVSAASVYNVEYEWADGLPIIGVIHSHNTMGAFFSGTDDSYINQNHDVSVVVSTSSRSPILGQVRVKTPCDRYILSEGTKVKFKVDYPVEYDATEFRTEFEKRIKTYTAPAIGYGNLRGFANFPNFGLGGAVQKVVRSAGQALGLVAKDGKTPPHEMSEAEIYKELEEVYSPTQIAALIHFGEDEEEIECLRELKAQGFQLVPQGTKVSKALVPVPTSKVEVITPSTLVHSEHGKIIKSEVNSRGVMDYYENGVMIETLPNGKRTRRNVDGTWTNLAKLSAGWDAAVAKEANTPAAKPSVVAPAKPAALTGNGNGAMPADIEGWDVEDAEEWNTKELDLSEDTPSAETTEVPAELTSDDAPDGNKVETIH